MNLRSQRRDNPELNLTPLIDVVFLLLIFFMVSTTFEKDARIKVELPEAVTQDQEPEEAAVLRITVDAEGQYYIDDRQVVSSEPDILKWAISKAADGRDDLSLVIDADGKASHQSVIRVMDAASQLGLVNMVLSARQPAGD